MENDFDAARDHRFAPTRWFEDFALGERFYIPSRTQTDALFAAFQQGATQVAEVVLENWMPLHVSQRAAYPARLVALCMAENGQLLGRLAIPHPAATPAVQHALH